MRRRHLKLLSLWILPLLVARMLIPAGFMLSVNADGLSLMFCPAGVVQVAGAAAHGEHHGMHHQDAGAHGEHDSASHNQDSAPCPFSLVASATPSVAALQHDGASAFTDERFDFISAPTLSVGPTRADRIRGPPAYA